VSRAPLFKLVVEVVSDSEVPSDILLLRALKCLGRSFGIRCLSIESIAAPPIKPTAKPTPKPPARVRRAPYDPESINAFVMPKE
jgi:hypothetical protein